jgi:hypothetical protein
MRSNSSTIVLSVFLFSFFCIAIKVQAVPLAGNYTINSGAATGGTNFDSFTDFTDAINTEGISADVVVTVVPGSGPYQEQVVINTVVGAGPDATVTLEGSGELLSAVTSSDNRHVLRLSNVSYFTINNLNIAWDPTSTGGFYGIHIFKTGSFITISNCSVNLTGTNSTLYGAFVASGSETSILSTGDFHNISILNNSAKGGGYGASVFGDVNNLASNILIAENSFLDAHSNGVYLRETDGAAIRDNFFDRTPDAGVSSGNAIQIAQNANINASIFNNEIQVTKTANGSITLRGIYLFNGTGHKVYNNVIHNILLESGNMTGIEIRTAGTAPEIYFNTISIDHAANTSGDLFGIRESLSNTNSILRNNLISISQPTTGDKAALALGATANVQTAFDTDYNILYAPDGNVAQRGTFNPTFYPTLPSWQGASTQDMNSLDLDPELESMTVSIPTNLAVNDKGIPVAGIALDFNGQLRGPVPDIGAYEFPSCTPAMLTFLIGPDDICENAFGLYTTTEIPGALEYIWTLPPGAEIIAGADNNVTVDFNGNGGTVSVSVQDTCGISDPLSMEVIILPLPDTPGPIVGPDAVCDNDIIVGFSVDPVSDADSYEWTVPAGAMILDGQGTDSITLDVSTLVGGDITVAAVNDCGSSAIAVLNVTINAAPNVDLVLEESYCSNLGTIMLSGGLPMGGTYTGPGVEDNILDPSGFVDSTYTWTYTYEDPTSGCSNTAVDSAFVGICLSATEWTQGTIHIFPIPTDGQIQVNTGIPYPISATLLTIDGKLLENFILTGSQEMDLSAYPSGTYILRLNSKGEILTRKIIKE